VDRAGLVGEDGETHHGVFDIGFLRQAPGMRVLCPASVAELNDMMHWAVLKCDGPVSVRYPRGGDRAYTGSAWNEDNGVCCHRDGTDVTLITYGTTVDNAMKAAELLEQRGIRAGVLRLLSVAPLPVKQICEHLAESRRVVVIEETCTGSGICQDLAWELGKLDDNCRVSGMDLGENFVSHGSVDMLYKHHGLDAESIANYVQEVLKVEN
jgi:1-deoxy-D-xylulose-5-phosphate synthase